MRIQDKTKIVVAIEKQYLLGIVRIVHIVTDKRPDLSHNFMLSKYAHITKITIFGREVMQTISRSTNIGFCFSGSVEEIEKNIDPEYLSLLNDKSR